MSARFEAFLARIYVDAEARARFLADPRAASAAARLSPEETEAAAKIDRLGLHLVANSLQRKRARRRGDS